MSTSKANFQELKPTNSVSGWEKAKDAVDLVGSGETLQQFKNKIRKFQDQLRAKIKKL